MSIKAARIMLAGIAAILVSAGAFGAELPTLHQVYEAVASGHYAEAQGMMDRVLRVHPNSAKAHFVEAELLAKQGQYRTAETELATAERLEPGLPFAKSASVAELKRRLRASHGTAPYVGGSAHAGNAFPWGMLMMGIGAVVLITLVMRTLFLRNAATPAYGTPGAAPPQAWAGNGPAGMAPMATPGSGIGSSLATGLATGVAVGAGMVAGEALAQHFLGNSNNANTLSTPVADTWAPAPNDDMGGEDFGVTDNSTWDDGASLGDGDDWS